jgi:hypothetical protein
VIRFAIVRAAAIVVNEDRTLELIGNFPDQLGSRFLQLGGFRQQLSNATNPQIFQFGTQCKTWPQFTAS